MTADVFLDTNILVYAAIGTGEDERKRKRALTLIESTEFGTSAQVLQEFFVTVVRKASRPLSVGKRWSGWNSGVPFRVSQLTIGW